MIRLLNKIRMRYYFIRAEIAYKIEIVQRIRKIARIVNQNYLSKEVVDIVRMYQQEGAIQATNMLMFYDWMMTSQSVTMQNKGKNIIVTFERKV